VRISTPYSMHTSKVGQGFKWSNSLRGAMPVTQRCRKAFDNHINQIMHFSRPSLSGRVGRPCLRRIGRTLRRVYLPSPVAVARRRAHGMSAIVPSSDSPPCPAFPVTLGPATHTLSHLQAGRARPRPHRQRPPTTAHSAIPTALHRPDRQILWPMPAILLSNP